MHFDKFCDEVKGKIDAHLKEIYKHQNENNLDTGGGVILYPNMLILSKTTDFYIAELVGAVRKYNGLSVKRNVKVHSINKYFNQFDDSTPAGEFHINASGCSFKDMCLSRSNDILTAIKRFPSINISKTILNLNGGSGSVFSFGSDCQAFSIENCLLINSKDEFIRCKSILAAFVFSKKIVDKDLDVYLSTRLIKDNFVAGIHTVAAGKDETLIVAGQLQNMYLFPKIHETSIGEFLKKHPEIIKAAFKTDDFKYEPTLKWIEHDGSCETKAINPDLMIRREDGFYDIYDLKTILANNKKTTTNKVERRKFISSIVDGISQLGYYREYFSYSKNAIYAEKNHGIKVKEPRLVLVVGSWENTYTEEVKQAMRSHKGVEIIDYDTFCHQFIDGSHDNCNH